MLDSAYPPSGSTLSAARGNAISVWGGYLASPHAEHAWAPPDWARVHAAGVLRLPIWVAPLDMNGVTPSQGTYDGNQAVADALEEGAYDGAVAVDVEERAWISHNDNAVAYARAFAAAVREHGARCVAYGPVAFLNALGESSVDVAWAALWPEVTPTDPSTAAVPGLEGFIGRRGWQYRGGHDFAGANVDSSVIDAITAGAPDAPPAPAPADENAFWYTVITGDSLFAIAERFNVPGGWIALYRANRAVVGSDPSLIHPGLRLLVTSSLPTGSAPAHPPEPAPPPATRTYTVQPGDTLWSIAQQLRIPGGWIALFSANHAVIGANPNLIHPGLELEIP